MLSLEKLSNPKNFREPLEIKGQDKSSLIQALKMMLTIRKTEECIADLVKTGVIKCPCHLAIGQEAVAVGIAKNLNNKDKVFGNHRSHAHYLALGGDIESLLAEVLGRITGCSKGMGGSMHLYDGKNGFHGSVPIVAGTIPLAVGAALAAKFDNKKAVSVAFFGDGACEEGILHECLNMSSIMKLPMVFIVENNLYSSHLDIMQRQPSDSVARFAEAHGIPYTVVDGNDVISVEKASKELIENARNAQGPAFIEAVTFRWLGHVGPNEDIDVGIRRSKKEVTEWKNRDPVGRLFQALEQQNLMTLSDFQKLNQQIDEQITISKNKALQAPWPDLENLNKFVYA